MPTLPIQPTPPQYPPVNPPPDLYDDEDGDQQIGIIPGKTPKDPADPRFPGSQPDLA